MTASSRNNHHFSQPRQSFCNYLHSEIEHLEERDFLTFRNDTVKLLSEIQYKAKECKRQVISSQQVTTYQLPEALQESLTTFGLCSMVVNSTLNRLISIPNEFSTNLLPLDILKLAILSSLVSWRLL